MSLKKYFISAALGLSFAGCAAAQPDASSYSPQNPPPASFVFAGPVAEPLPSGETAVRFKFALAIHTLAPTRIQIVDKNTGAVLIDDAKPVLKATPIRHPSNPAIAISLWEGLTAPEPVTSSSPAWLYEPTNTKASLEARVYSEGQAAFTFAQSATYVYAAKLAILEAVKFNSPASGSGK
jgi:hypothetical protein